MRTFITIFALALMLITVGLYRFINNDWVSWRQAEDANKKGDYRQAMAKYSVLWSRGFKPALVFPRLFVLIYGRVSRIKPQRSPGKRFW